MPKIKKKIASLLPQNKRLYYGTSEKIAKLVVVNGLKPHLSEFSDIRLDINYLSDAYGGYMAFCNSNVEERWGIIEIDREKLLSNKLVAENFLLNENKRRSKKQIMSHDKTWEQSIKETGFCIYAGTIPATAIRKIAIYNPFSNWFLTKQVLHTSLGSAFHESNLHKNMMLSKWFMGEFVSIQDWIADSVVSDKEKEEMQLALYERSGLDIFYHGDE